MAKTERPFPNSGENEGVLNKQRLLATRLFPETISIGEIESRYPARHLIDGAKVTRVAPSPTGSVHIGSLYVALISERLAHQSGGVFYVRIEDTDKAREIPGAAQLIAQAPLDYGIAVDEGVLPDGQEGAYGPYIQSQRREIYTAYAKDLVARGLAYPCFCSIEELRKISETQENIGVNPGYYGQWAIWRNKDMEDIGAALSSGASFVIRLRSNGDAQKTLVVKDIIRGDLNLHEDNQDIVLLKSDGTPTYHFAHVIDDHLMGTTDVIRGDEWVSSIARHVQLFQVMGWQHPNYGHISPIQKMEGQSRVKLSKRKHPEAGLAYYRESGYPADAVVEYLLNLANSGFEKWRRENPDSNWRDYYFNLSGLNGNSGALFDQKKLRSYSREVIATMNVEQLLGECVKWSSSYDQELANALNNDKNYSRQVLAVEAGEGAKGKRLTTFADFKNSYGFFFDELFHPQPEELKVQLALKPNDVIKASIEKLIVEYDDSDTREQWLEKVYQICDELGYAHTKKAFDANPDKFKGHFGDVAMIYRVALAGENKSPDLFDVMKVMGKSRIEKRFRTLLTAFFN